METRVHIWIKHLLLVIKLAVIYGICFFSTQNVHAQDIPVTQANKRLVREGFEKWANHTGSFFDLLDENVQWTISGSSPEAKTYHSKKQLNKEALNPLNARLSQKITPQLQGIYAEADEVIAIWNGKARDINGKPYNATYAWFMKIVDSKITEVTAFLDNSKLSALLKLPVNYNR